MQRIKVNTKKSYEIVLAKDYSLVLEEIKKVFFGQKILIVSDDKVFPLYGKNVIDVLGEYDVYKYVIKNGEASKNVQNYINIIDFLAENKFCRKDLVVALGGGVVGDLAGFCASTFERGINFISLPTTLLSMVDSSVGGKTAIDLKQGKNLLGSFYQPSLVYVNTECLKTLDDSEVTNGMGEIIKYAFISKEKVLEQIQENNIEKLISTCLKIKAKVVEEDEFENNNRMILNFGHTIGHAIESLSNYSLSHGLCVAKGINAIIDISSKYYNLDEKTRRELKNLLNVYSFDLSIPYKKEEIINKIYSDKKAEGSKTNIVLTKGIGKVKIEQIEIEKLKELLSWSVIYIPQQ